MKTTSVLIMAVALTGCVSMPDIPNEKIETYRWTPANSAALETKIGKVSDVVFSYQQLAFKFTNTSKETSKIIWDETVLVINGTAKKVLPVGAKFSEAGRSLPPEVVPSNVSVSTGVSRADNLSYSSGTMIGRSYFPGGWTGGEIVPCGTNQLAAYLKCNPLELVGAPVSLILAVETGGKKIEYKIEGKLEKNPAFVEPAPKPSQAAAQ